MIYRFCVCSFHLHSSHCSSAPIAIAGEQARFRSNASAAEALPLVSLDTVMGSEVETDLADFSGKPTKP